MEKRIITTEKAPSSPLYSQGVRAGSTIQEQTQQALRNCTAIVEAGGGRLGDVAQVTVLLANPADFAGMNGEYAKVFAAEAPARAVAKLGVELPNVLVSIMMTAHVEG